MADELLLPLRIDPVTGDLAVLEQDSDVEVDQSVRLLVRSRPLTFECEPGYGVLVSGFTDVRAAEVEAAIALWEPRSPHLVTVGDVDARGVRPVLVDRPPTPAQEA